jgi:hypothetical protein
MSKYTIIGLFSFLLGIYNVIKLYKADKFN